MQHHQLVDDDQPIDRRLGEHVHMVRVGTGAGQGGPARGVVVDRAEDEHYAEKGGQVEKRSPFRRKRLPVGVSIDTHSPRSRFF